MMITTRTCLALALALAVPAAQAADSASTSSSQSSSRNGENRNASSQNSSSSNDQDDARDALRRKQVMPLTAILEIAFKREKGTVLEVELETEDGVLTYKIELLSEAGRKVLMWINARNGDILKVRNR